MQKQISEILKPALKLQPVPTGITSSGNKLHGIKAVIFDIYGTLLISGSGDVGTAIKAGSDEAFSESMITAGLPEPSAEAAELIRSRFFNLIEITHNKLRIKGVPYPEVDIVEIWTQLIASPDISAKYPEIRNLQPQQAAATYESIVNPVYEMPGALKLIKSLTDKGYQLGIVSNAQFYTPLIFETVFGKDFESLGFKPSLCLFSYLEKRSKPDTLLFKKLIKNLSDIGIKSEESVFIGNDMLKDIMPASITGFKTALFAGDKRSLRLREEHDACSNIEPDVIVNNILDLLVYIQEG